MPFTRAPAVLLAGLASLTLAFGAGVQASRTALVRAGDQSALLQSTARTTALQLSQQAERNRTIAILLAENPAFTDFYTSPGTREAKIRGHGRDVQRIEVALEQLRTLLGGRIGTSSYIDASGSENVRMVDLVSTPPDALSANKSQTPYFPGALAQHRGEVYQSSPYVSLETGQWVVTEAAPVDINGQNVAFVQFEVPIETLRASAAASAGAARVRVLEAATGAVIIDSFRRQEVGEPLGSPRDSSFLARARTGKLTGHGVVGKQDTAFAEVPSATSGGTDANSWVVVTSRPRGTSGLVAALTPLVLVLGLLGLLLVAAAVPMFGLARRQRRAQRQKADADHALLSGRLDDITRALTQVAQGDLAVRLPSADLGDESLDRLVHSFDETVSRLRVLVGDAQTNGDQLSHSADDLRSMAAEQADAATQQASVVARTTATIEQLAATSSQIAETTSGVSAAASHTQQLAEEGRTAVAASVEAMDRIAARVVSMSESSTELEKYIGEVGRILEVIDALSDQTNLLALNAAIEAARAGEHGRGFAVVAVEVRKLAERAHSATALIQTIVTQIQSKTAASVMECEQGTVEVTEGAALAHEVAERLERIADVARATTASAQEISAATAQQRSASHEVVTEMARVAEGSRRYADGSHQTASAAEGIAALSGRVRNSIETFRVTQDA